MREWDCDWKDFDFFQYHGRKNTTKLGHTCIPWNKVARSNNPFPEETHNYCRNGGKHYLWCYTSTKGDKDECYVRRCMECDSGEFSETMCRETTCHGDNPPLRQSASRQMAPGKSFSLNRPRFAHIVSDADSLLDALSLRLIVLWHIFLVDMFGTSLNRGCSKAS